MGHQRAILCGYYGFGNGGDEALLDTLLTMLPPHVEPLVLSAAPAATAQLHDVKAYDRKDLNTLWSLLRTADALIWGGGSLIQDATSRLSPVYYAGLMGFAQGLGLTTIAWAQGIGPLNRNSTRWLARKAFQGCTVISVRDHVSATLVSEDWQRPCTLAPDPVWALESKPDQHLQNIEEPRIAVILSAKPKLTPQRLQGLTEALVMFQNETQVRVLLLPFQVSDLAISEFIHNQLPDSSYILQISDPRELKGLFREVEMTIAMRLHGVIMAAAEGCRCFGISYDPKVRRLMEDLPCPGWDLEHLPQEPAIIAQAWLTQFREGKGLSTEQIRVRVKQALKHQQILHNALVP